MTTKQEALTELAIDIKACKRCPLYATRDLPTISRGDPRSPLVIVIDYPREADHKAELTLSGRAGKKIDKLLEEAGLKPDQVFFTSLLKCFPGRGKYFPEDDSPAKCFGFLGKQLSIIKPMVVVVAGPQALAWMLLRGTEFKVDSRGKDITDWMDKLYRRQAVYDQLRFAVIPSIHAMSKDINEELENQTVTVLRRVKDFIVARQKGDVTPDIETEDLEKKVVKSKKDQGELFKWTKPAPKPETEERPE